MNPLAHASSFARALLLVVPAVSACSAAAEPATERQTGQALAQDSDSAVPCPPATPRDAPGYDPPWGRVGFRLGPIPTFSDEMTALGCGPETLYHHVARTTGDVAVAFCPGAPPAPASTIAPDSCVGTPPDGWVVAVWNAHPPTPPAGCTVKTCYPL